jgi:hypothetical protein
MGLGTAITWGITILSCATSSLSSYKQQPSSSVLPVRERTWQHPEPRGLGPAKDQ